MIISSRFKSLPIALFLLAAITFTFSCSHKISRVEKKKLQGKTFVVTGASSGFGQGVALKLGEYRANVVLAARRTDLLDEIAAKIRIAGGSALVVTTDVSNYEDIQRLADTTIKRFGHIDAWINNAGIGAIGPFWDIPIKDQMRVIDVNLKGVIYGSYEAIKIFRNQKYGILINTGSIDSEVPLAYQGSYSASKAGVRSLGEVINQELRLAGYKNIKVTTIEPWAVDTPWWGHAANYSGGTPRMKAMDDPYLVVDVIIWSYFHPRKEIPVGPKAKASYFFHHLCPHFTEKLSANYSHKYQIRFAPPAKDTSGTLYTPMESGRGVDDGVRQRIKKEKEERKSKVR